MVCIGLGAPVLQAVASSARCERFSGADLAGLAREAAVAALREILEGRGHQGLVLSGQQAAGGGPGNLNSVPLGTSLKCPAPVHQRHFLAALSRTAPSVSLADERMYNALRGRMEQARSHLAAPPVLPEATRGISNEADPLVSLPAAVEPAVTGK